MNEGKSFRQFFRSRSRKQKFLEWKWKWKRGELASSWSNKMHWYQNINSNKCCCSCSQSREVVIDITENKNASQGTKQYWGSGTHQQLCKMPDQIPPCACGEGQSFDAASIYAREWSSLLYLKNIKEITKPARGLPGSTCTFEIPGNPGCNKLISSASPTVALELETMILLSDPPEARIALECEQWCFQSC